LGFDKPSKANEEAFYFAAKRVSAFAQEMKNALNNCSETQLLNGSRAGDGEKAAVRYGTLR